jgi:hypothetical protein
MPAVAPPRGFWLPPVAARRQLFGAMVRLGVTGLIAIGLSGAVAAGMGAAFGERFVAGDPPYVAYTKERCADFFEYEPRATSCEDAATRHHVGEVVQYRIAAGALGLVALGLYVVAKRRWTWIRDRSNLPAGFEATVGTSTFGLATVALAGQGLELFGIGGAAGAGQYLSGGLVAAVVAGWYGRSLYRTLSRPAA